MIVFKPESTLGMPQRAWVEQRAAKVSKELPKIVGDTNVQLCPRAIETSEQYFADDPEAIIYGCVVKDRKDGLKSALYKHLNGSVPNGKIVHTIEDGLAYIRQQRKLGNHVRTKDPYESSGRGQIVVETIKEGRERLRSFSRLKDYGLILMPDLAEIEQRVHVGRINLGRYGIYSQCGTEQVAQWQDGKIFAGGEIAMFRAGDEVAARKAIESVSIPQHTRQLGEVVIDKHANFLLHMGRLSLDILVGRTRTGERLEEVVDNTMRVSGLAPAEILALIALKDAGPDVFARTVCNYEINPPKGYCPPAEFEEFIRHESLAVSARVVEVG